MSDNELVKQSETSLSTDFSKFESFLIELGLPSTNIIAAPEERVRIMQALPDFVNSIPPEIRKDARYLSKFIAGSAVGLFDAALNFVWNEVVVSLWKKVDTYGLDIFFDAAVDENIRDQYNSFEDLSGLKDRVLLDTCLKLEIVSGSIHKKLCHILDMRNDIGSSHPNSYSINSYELLGWLQTCIQEVLTDEASVAAITIKSLIGNLKKRKTKLDAETIQSFEQSVKNISSVMTGNLLTTVFSLYVSGETKPIVKENILEMAPIIWNHTMDESKYDLGEKYDVYKSNMDHERKSLADVFFEKCDGRNYLSIDTRIIKLSVLCDELEKVHADRYNFYLEVPIIRSIMTFIKSDSDIPVERKEKLIRTISVCAIGREVDYCGGVSPGAKPYYISFLKMLNKEQVKDFLRIVSETKIRNTIYGSIRRKNLKSIISEIKSPVFGDRMNEILDYLLKSNKIETAFITKDYKDLIRGIL